MEKSSEEKLVDVVLGLLFMIPLALYGGFVATQFWNWFVVPLGMAPIRVVHMMGLAYFVSLFRNDFAANEVLKEKSMTVRLFYSIFSHTFMWGVGALVHALM